MTANKVNTAFRAARLGPVAVEVTHESGGVVHMRSPHTLGTYPAKLTERLEHWAQVAPRRTFLAERDGAGNWRGIDYAQTLLRVRSLAQALIDRGLSVERPLLILSGNDIEHALLALAAQYAGVPYAPVSPAYSLLSRDFGRLRHIVSLLTPGLVFTADAGRFANAIAAAVNEDVEVMTTRGEAAGRRVTSFSAAQATAPTAAVERAHASVGPDTIAKFLFTSGSTALPKGVINTQRMLCSNQQMLAEAFPLLQDTPPVLVDWLPWNHTFGGNHNVGLVLYNGGTLYIDDGRPIAGEFDKTVRNLREIAPTAYFNVPRGYEVLLPYLQREPALRRTFFSRVSMLFYAGAGLSQHVWEGLEQVEIDACGERIMMITGLGATETAPSVTFANWPGARAGMIGLPVPGQEIKLVPVAGKLEMRVKGPNVTPGYWRAPDPTRAVFDDEGYYCMGDAVRWVDPAEPRRGLLFDGRIAEDFKLSTGTWVSVGPLRTQVILACAPLVHDVVFAAPDRDEIAALIFPQFDACRELCPELAAGATAAEVVAHPAVRGRFQQLLGAFTSAATGSSTRIVRALLLDTPPSIDAGEMTDKGSVNQRAVLSRRADVVEELYREPPSPWILVIDAERTADAV